MKKIIFLTYLFLCTTITYAQTSDPLANMFLNDNGSVSSNSNMNGNIGPSLNANTEVSPAMPVSPATEPSSVPPIGTTTVIPPTQDPQTSPVPSNKTPPAIGASNENGLHAAASTNSNTNESLSNSNTNGEGGALPQTGETAIPLLIIATILSLLATKSLAWPHSHK